jgi:hypothetical protein
MQKMSRCLALALLWVGIGPVLLADEPPSLNEEQVQRLAKVCKVWGTVRYFHPYLAYKGIDWDDALVKTVPKVVRSKSTDEYAAAVQGMLDALGDPATVVVRQVSTRSTDQSKANKRTEVSFSRGSPRESWLLTLPGLTERCIFLTISLSWLNWRRSYPSHPG